MKKQSYLFIITYLVVFILMGCLQNCNREKPISQNEYENNYKFGKLKWNGEWILHDTTKWAYPCTLDSTILALFHNWDDSTTLWFKNLPDTTLVYYNLSTGMWLRNSYGLWVRTCLVEHFWEMGIFHPDDISAIILTSYHRYLNGKDIELEKQVEMYKLFWKNEFGIVYRLQDSASWEFPPSMWDMGFQEYNIEVNE